MNNHLPNIFKGAAMGIAEVIPGVSGGTIAFITGIYEKLLNTIKAFGPGLFSTFKNEGLNGVWNEVNGTFLVTLLIGMAGGVLVGVFGITYLLENYPILVWAFFFGLIIASAIYIGKQLTKWTAVEIGLLILGTIVAYAITVLVPAEGSTSLPFVFISGAIAISALILPGISGSFVLLLMGMYTIIIPTIKNALKTFETSSLIIVVVFALGCLTGLLTFSRVLSWTFKNYKNQTLAILTGFMIGSLNKIWPWRIPTIGLNKETGQGITDSSLLAKGGEEMKIIKEANLMPWDYPEANYLFLAVAFMVVGFIAVFVLERFGSKPDELV